MAYVYSGCGENITGYSMAGTVRYTKTVLMYGYNMSWRPTHSFSLKRACPWGGWICWPSCVSFSIHPCCNSHLDSFAQYVFFLLLSLCFYATRVVHHMLVFSNKIYFTLIKSHLHVRTISSSGAPKSTAWYGPEDWFWWRTIFLCEMPTMCNILIGENVCQFNKVLG